MSELIDEDTINIPVVAYPPFQLRSSLIDKDPVIWAHLLEGYIQLMSLLLDEATVQRRWSVRTNQQLALFLQGYLQETAAEQSQVFSLGAINPDITKNSGDLRAAVFQVLKAHSLLKLGLTGEAMWNFIKVYVAGNASTVRTLVDGSFKSKFNNNRKSGNISSISSIHKHLEHLITNNKFSKADLKTLALLLGTQGSPPSTTFINTSRSTASKTALNTQRNINKRATTSSKFGVSFLTSGYIDMLEKLYLAGKSVHASVSSSIMIVSLLALPSAATAALAVELGINNLALCRLYPLFAGVILSPAYAALCPGLEMGLPWLTKGAASSPVVFDESSLQVLVDFFPTLTPGQAKTILHEYSHNVESATNALLEDPERMATLVEYSESAPPTATSEDAPPRRGIYDDDEFARLEADPSKVHKGKKKLEVEVDTTAKETLKHATLTAALRLLYESDEDEPDDTYADSEKTKGDAMGNRVGSGALDAEESKTDKIEAMLWGIFKKNQALLLERDQRKSKARKEIRDSTGWSDEQIEGWARMLERNPRRCKLLEEKHMFSGNRVGGVGAKSSTRYRKPTAESDEEEEPAKQERYPISRPEMARSQTPKREGGSQSKAKEGGPKPQSTGAKESRPSTTSTGGREGDSTKKQNSKNEKNKASKANHNRKAGHDKKMAKA